MSYEKEDKKKDLDYCIQGHGHSEGSKCQWMFVRWYFLNCRSLCYQARYVYTASLAGVKPRFLNWTNF